MAANQPIQGKAIRTISPSRRGGHDDAVTQGHDGDEKLQHEDQHQHADPEIAAPDGVFSGRRGGGFRRALRSGVPGSCAALAAVHVHNLIVVLRHDAAKALRRSMHGRKKPSFRE